MEEPRIAVISSPGFDEVAPAWQDLVGRMDRPGPGCSLAWNRNTCRLAERSSAAVSLSVLRFLAGDRVLAILPLLVERLDFGPLRYAGVNLLCAESLRSGNFPMDPGFPMDEFVRHLLAWYETQGPGRSLFEFALYREGPVSPVFEAPPALVSRVETILNTPVMALPGDPEVLEKQLRGRVSKASIQRDRRVLESFGPVEVRRPANDEEIRAMLETLFDLHRRRWNPTATPSKFEDPAQRELLLDSAPLLLREGILDLVALAVGNRYAVVHWNSVCGDEYRFTLTAYDREFSRGAPTIVLLDHLIRESSARGLRHFSFLGSLDAYKFRWPCVVEGLDRVRVARRSDRLILSVHDLRQRSWEFRKSIRSFLHRLWTDTGD